jgi:glycosyltransferase involved in cell wall biosynthesis
MKHAPQAKTTKISVIMPAKNVGRFAVAAIESIRQQTIKDWEMIAVNDGSTDNTGQILAKFAQKDKRIKLITNRKSKGIGVSLNLALRQTQGDYIARMDADDIALPQRFALQLKYLETHPKVVAVGGQAQMIDGQGIPFAYKRFPTNPKKLREIIMWMVPFQHPIAMVRAEAYKKCRYDETLKTAEDVDWMMKLLQYGEFGNLKQMVYQYRKADTSNGYHNVKQTFYLTLLGRWRGITRYGYKPTLKGILLSFAQLLVVTMLPAKWVVKLYENRRFIWIYENVRALWPRLRLVLARE